MATKKKTAADQPIETTPIEKTPTESNPTPKAAVEVDWGKGFVEHNDAIVSGRTIKVPVPVRARHALGQSQSRDRYARIRVKLNGDEVRIAERRYHQASSEAQPSLTFELAE